MGLPLRAPPVLGALVCVLAALVLAAPARGQDEATIRVDSSADNRTADDHLTVREALELVNRGFIARREPLTPGERALTLGSPGPGKENHVDIEVDELSFLRPLPAVFQDDTTIEGHPTIF